MFVVFAAHSVCLIAYASVACDIQSAHAHINVTLTVYICRSVISITKNNNNSRVPLSFTWKLALAYQWPLQLVCNLLTNMFYSFLLLSLLTLYTILSQHKLVCCCCCDFFQYCSHLLFLLFLLLLLVLLSFSLCVLVVVIALFCCCKLFICWLLVLILLLLLLDLFALVFVIYYLLLLLLYTIVVVICSIWLLLYVAYCCCAYAYHACTQQISIITNCRQASRGCVAQLTPYAQL